jgi:hypothetical protein
MKSTAPAALASLKHKFNAKILEVGKLKNEVKALRFGEMYGKGTDGSRLLADQTVQLSTQRIAIATLESSLAAQLGRTDRANIRANSAERLLRDAKSSVENWKSLAVVLCIVGVTLGGLAQYAYSLNMLA